MTDRRAFDKRIIMLRSESQRSAIIDAITHAPIDPARPLRFILDDPLPSKSRDQEAKYHAMIGNIARQYEHCGRKWDADDMKRILIDQFRRDTSKDPDFADLWAGMGMVNMAPSFDGTGTVLLGAQSRKFPMKLATVFITWLEALGAELGICFTASPNERKP